jgi:hypothetical protein
MVASTETAFPLVKGTNEEMRKRVVGAKRESFMVLFLLKKGNAEMGVSQFMRSACHEKMGLVPIILLVDLCRVQYLSYTIRRCSYASLEKLF